MGVEHYLVDDEGRNVLDVHKWYALRPDDRGNVTEADIRAGSRCDKLGDVGWLVDAALAWLREVAQGRKVRLVTDSTDSEDQCWMDWETFRTRPEWTCWSAFWGGSDGCRGWKPWPPDARKQALAAQKALLRKHFPILAAAAEEVEATAKKNARRLVYGELPTMPLPEGASGWCDGAEMPSD